MGGVGPDIDYPRSPPATAAPAPTPLPPVQSKMHMGYLVNLRTCDFLSGAIFLFRDTVDSRTQLFLFRQKKWGKPNFPPLTTNSEKRFRPLFHLVKHTYSSVSN